jgi:hypothetical protein
MNNYLKKYSNYFIGIGVVLLLMYFLDIVPFRFRNAPESLRLFMPIIFIIVGIIGNFLENENSNISHYSENNDQPFDNEKYRVDKKDLTGVYSKDEIEKFIKAGRILSKTKIWKQDWYEWKSVKDTEFHYLLRKENNFQLKPFIIISILAFSGYLLYNFLNNKRTLYSLFESCECESLWQDSLNNSTIRSFDERHPKESYNPYRITWENREADVFINSIGGKKYYLSFSSAFSLFLNNDELILYDDGEAYSYEQSHDFSWEFKNNKLMLFDALEGTDMKLFIGEIINKNGQAYFIESTENKRERGLLTNELPTRIKDLCACRCNREKQMEESDYTPSELTLDQMLNRECNYIFESDEYFTPWGEMKEILIH